MATTLRKRGRPTKYRDEYDDLAYRYCLLGATNDQLAEFFGVDPSTVDVWIKERPTFQGAIKQGRAEADARVGTALFERATGYSHPAIHITNYQGAITETPYTKHYPPDPASMIFWLKNRRPDLWRDKHEVSGPDGGPIPIAQVEWNVIKPSTE